MTAVNGEPTATRYKWVIDAFMDEALEEMRNQPDQVEDVFGEMAIIFGWVGTGRWPEGFVPDGKILAYMNRLELESVGSE